MNPANNGQSAIGIGQSALGSGSQFVTVENNSNVCQPQQRRQISDQEAQSLAEAFNSLIYTQCREQLELSLALIRSGKFSCDAAKQCATVKKVGIKIERALKTLTCTSIHLSGIESGGAANPEWFVNFLFRSLVAADSKCAEPPARSIIESFGSYQGSVMANLAAEVSLSELGITDKQAVGQLGGAIYAAKAIRLEILELSLSGEKSLLRQRTSTNFLQKLASTIYQP